LRLARIHREEAANQHTSDGEGGRIGAIGDGDSGVRDNSVERGLEVATDSASKEHVVLSSGGVQLVGGAVTDGLVDRSNEASLVGRVRTGGSVDLSSTFDLIRSSAFGAYMNEAMGWILFGHDRRLKEEGRLLCSGGCDRHGERERKNFNVTLT